MKERKNKHSLYVYTKHDTVMERDMYEAGVLKGWIKERQSYLNVFNGVERNTALLKSMRCEVAYGYIEINKELYLRHCFLVQKDKIIDTNRHFYEEIKEVPYIVFKKMSIQEYAQHLINGEDGRDLQLRNTLREYEETWYEYARNKGIESVG